MKRIILISLIFLFGAYGHVRAQRGNISYNLTALPGFTSQGNIPFWLRSNQFGSIPLDGASLSLTGSARKDYGKTKTGIFDWGASLEGRLNVGNKSNFNLIEGYGKLRLSIFEFRAGRAKEAIGLRDSSLSSGSFSVSENALGIPKVQIAIPEFYSLPLFGRLLAFKGHFAHGWLGEISMSTMDNDTLQISSYFHQKSLYGRFGKLEWKWKLYGGFDHQVLWGNEKSFYGDIFTLTPFRSWLYVITGTTFGNSDIASSKVGNHLGSIDLGFEYEFKKFKLLLYRQNFYEAGALYYLANIQDGLNGFSLENKKRNNKMFTWKKFLFELLYTKNQAGEPWSPPTPSPYEGYYNHYQYINGWSYYGVGLGTPFISTRSYVRDGLPAFPYEYFINNRVLVFHMGLEGTINKLNYTFKTSWSKNYGTYRTTNQEQSTNVSNPGAFGIFGLRKQLSTFIECSRELTNGLNLGCVTAFDIGELYYNSFGVLLMISQSF